MKDIDVAAMAELTIIGRQRSALRSDDLTLERARNFFDNIREKRDKTLMITARDEKTGELVGRMSVHIEYPELGIILLWDPLVHPDRDPDKVAIALIEHSKTLVNTHGRTRLEVLLPGGNEKTEELLSTYISWYEACGFSRVGTDEVLEAELSELILGDTTIPAGMELIPLKEVSNAEIRETVLTTFRAGKDAWFLNQKELQQEAVFSLWFDRGTSLNREASILAHYPPDDDASFVLKEDGKIIGFIVARIEDSGAKLGPVGVLPDYRGKGLGKLLLSLSIARLKAKGVETAWLRSSTSNDAAYRLYTGIGLKKQGTELIYAWEPREFD
jgi:ribosomal protein S18 acetylase RimI-like enzyme